MTVVEKVRYLLLSVLCLNEVIAFKLIKYTGGGIYFWWQAGASKYLQEKGKLRKDVDVLGLSAGSLSAALFVTQANFDQAADFAIAQAHRERLWSNPGGLTGVWGGLVEEWLGELISEKITPDNVNSLAVVATPVALTTTSKILRNFSNKQDVIDACMVSVHIPFFMDGRLYRKYNGDRYIDGSFWPYVTNGRIPDPIPDRNCYTDLFNIDYRDDGEFLSKMDGSFVRLISPNGLYDMVNAGYLYMKKLDAAGRIPDLFVPVT